MGNNTLVIITGGENEELLHNSNDQENAYLLLKEILDSSDQLSINAIMCTLKCLHAPSGWMPRLKILKRRYAN